MNSQGLIPSILLISLGFLWFLWAVGDWDQKYPSALKSNVTFSAQETLQHQSRFHYPCSWIITFLTWFWPHIWINSWIYSHQLTQAISDFQEAVWMISWWEGMDLSHFRYNTNGATESEILGLITSGCHRCLHQVSCWLHSPWGEKGIFFLPLLTYFELLQ